MDVITYPCHKPNIDSANLYYLKSPLLQTYHHGSELGRKRTNNDDIGPILSRLLMSMITVETDHRKVPQVDKSHNALNNPLDKYPTMHHFATEMCIFLLQNDSLWGVKRVHCGIYKTGLLAQNRIDSDGIGPFLVRFLPRLRSVNVNNISVEKDHRMISKDHCSLWRFCSRLRVLPYRAMCQWRDLCTHAQRFHLLMSRRIHRN